MGDPICRQCGGPIKDRLARSIYCSVTCNDKARYNRTRPAEETRTCDRCGTPFTTRRATKRFCSTTCGQADRNDRVAGERVLSKAARPPCVGCGMPIDPARSGKVRYCTRECRIRSRRHEAYGLTADELAALLATHPSCAICGFDQWGSTGPTGPQVDHDHATGAVRGVLCTNCNNGLGRFRDDPELLARALAYLTG